MGLSNFERRVEGAVEGLFARVFKSGLKPVELGRKLTREMDDNRTVDVRGRTITVNDFMVALAPGDYENFAGVEEALGRELADAAREHARDEGYIFMGPVRVDLEPQTGLRLGTFMVTGRLKEGEGGTGAGALILPGGDRIPLGEHPVNIGRLPECTIVLSDKNVSRTHVEIRPQGNGWLLVDLQSTNGTKLNGNRVTEQILRDGDTITLGGTSIIFEAS